MKWKCLPAQPCIRQAVTHKLVKAMKEEKEEERRRERGTQVMWPHPEPMSRKVLPSSTCRASKQVAYICGAEKLNANEGKRRAESYVFD